MAVEAPRVSVGAMLQHRTESLQVSWELLAGRAGLGRLITQSSIQKTGLAFAGFDTYLHPGRVLVLAESEIRYLEALPAAIRIEAIRRAFAHDIPCVLVTEGLIVGGDLIAEAERAAMPILRTSLSTPEAMTSVTTLLEDCLAPRDLVHGVLLDILGLGVLLVGESGIGKSECALDLIVRGHRLVADDAVEVKRCPEQIIVGTCPELTRSHMELRGIGIINVTELFGVASTRGATNVEFVVQLERWQPTYGYDRLGLEEPTYDILGIPVPMIRMPVAPGRNLAILVEVSARNHLLRLRGHHTARELVQRVDEGLASGSPAKPPDRRGRE